MKTVKYSFNVTNAADIDLERILDEENNADVVLVCDAVFIKQSFLDTFTEADGLYVTGELLKPSWGHGSCFVRCVQSCKQAARVVLASSGGKLINTHRARTTQKTLDEIHSEVQKAIAYQRKIKVTVTAITAE